MKKFVLILFLLLELFLLTNSNLVIIEFKKTLNIIMYNLMPTMFLSILFTSVLINLNIENYFPNFIFKLFNKYFNLSKNETIIFIFSIISGYPNNARMLINNKNLNNIIKYTSFVSPFFLISTVNNIYLKNIKITLIILISHISTNIIIGRFLRFNNNSNNIEETSKKYTTNVLDVYYNSLKSTTISLSIIFSNILFFSSIISLLKDILPFNNIINSLIIGLFEFSSGIYEVSMLNISNFLKGLLILIIISFNSISVHMQMLSINNKIKYSNFLASKILNIFLSIIIYILLYTLTNII